MKPIRVLVVDDSAFARKVIREVLSKDPMIEVIGIARDGLDALEKITELMPDVVTLDLVMPDLDGIGVLKALPKNSNTRVIIVSVSNADSELAVQALQLGAIAIVTKATPLPTDRLYEISKKLIDKVKEIASAMPRLHAGSENAPVSASVHSTDFRLMVIGTSTGGPQALTQLFRTLPADLPVAVAIALHIPEGYTKSMATRLSSLGGLQIDEAVDGMQIQKGRAVLAPGGMHLTIEARGDEFFAQVSYQPLESVHHPSVDLLFQSAADAAGASTLGVILTGMGSDGALGARAIRKCGGKILAESDESCIVYGMPRTVIEDGTATAQATIDNMSELIVQTLSAKP